MLYHQQCGESGLIDNIMDIYNKKVGINRRISITNLDSIINKNTYNIKEIKHKWMKLSENPDIEPKDIFTDFNVGG